MGRGRRAREGEEDDDKEEYRLSERREKYEGKRGEKVEAGGES